MRLKEEVHQFHLLFGSSSHLKNEVNEKNKEIFASLSLARTLIVGEK